MKISRWFIRKSIAVFTLTAFICSSVCFEAAQGINTLVSENNLMDTVQNKLAQFAIPYAYGRITGGSLYNKEKLVVYIHDLHCHPEVQENIARLISIFDKKYGVRKIWLEGAPAGQVNTSIFDSIPDEKIRKITLETMLKKGLLSGAEYYAAINNQNKLHGLEKWDTYVDNLKLMQNLIDKKTSNTDAGERLLSKLDTIKDRYLSHSLKRLRRQLHDDKKKDYGRKIETRYLRLARIAEESGEALDTYPNLNRFVQIHKIQRGISVNRLPRELNSYINELRASLPYSIYKTLQEKQEHAQKGDEYYRRLSEIAEEYSPLLNAKYPAAAQFLQQERLNYMLNPSHLVSEEDAFCERVLNKQAVRLADKEVLFLLKMGDLFNNFVSLKLTSDEFTYFREHTEQFKTVLQKYTGPAEASETLSLIDSQSFNRFYETNICRNDIFIENITAGTKPNENVLPLGGTQAVLEQIGGFKNIEIVVTGGFHSNITKELEANNISYLAVMPNIEQKFDEKIYERVITGKTNVQSFLASALAPPSPDAAILDSRLSQIHTAYLLNIAEIIIGSAQGAKYNVEAVKKIIEEYNNRLGSERENGFDVQFDGNNWTIKYAGQSIQIPVKTGLSPDGFVHELVSALQSFKKLTHAAVNYVIKSNFWQRFKSGKISYDFIQVHNDRRLGKYAVIRVQSLLRKTGQLGHAAFGNDSDNFADEITEKYKNIPKIYIDAGISQEDAAVVQQHEYDELIFWLKAAESKGLRLQEVRAWIKGNIEEAKRLDQEAHAQARDISIVYNKYKSSVQKSENLHLNFIGKSDDINIAASGGTEISGGIVSQTHPAAKSAPETARVQADEAIADLEDCVSKALLSYSNIHRGSGHNSRVSTEAFETAQKVIVLDYLLENNPLLPGEKEDYAVIFCDDRSLGNIINNNGNPLQAGTYVVVKSGDFNLPLGINAVAAQKNALTSTPVDSGGGTVKLVTPKDVLFDNAPERFEAGTPAIISVIALAKAILLVRKYNNPDIFRARTRVEHTVSLIDADNFPGIIDNQEKLEILRKDHIGRDDVYVPIGKTGYTRYTNLDNGASTPTFAPIFEVFRSALREPDDSHAEILYKVRQISERFFKAPLMQYRHIFTSNTTGGTNIAAELFRNRAEQNIDEDIVVVTSKLEHNSNEIPYRSIPRVSIERLDVDTDGFIYRDQLEKLLMDYNGENGNGVNTKHGRKHIRLVAITGASNVLGTFNQIYEIAALAHKYGAEILVDGAQLTAHQPISLAGDGNTTDSRDSSIDYFAYSAHKVYAPFGSGGFIAKQGLLNNGFSAERQSEIQAAGDLNAAGIAALGESLHLLEQITMDTVAQDEDELRTYLLDKLRSAAIPGLEIRGISQGAAEKSPDNEEGKRGGVVVFKVKSLPHSLITKILAEQGGIGVRGGCFCAHILVQSMEGMGPVSRFIVRKIILSDWIFNNFPSLGERLFTWVKWFFPGLVRVSLGLENTREDVDHLVQVLKDNISDARQNRSLRQKFADIFLPSMRLPETAEAGRIDNYVNEAVKNIYGADVETHWQKHKESVSSAVSEAVTESLQKKKWIKRICDRLFYISWIEREKVFAPVIDKQGIIIAQKGDEEEAFQAAAARGNAGIKTIILREKPLFYPASPGNAIYVTVTVNGQTRTVPLFVNKTKKGKRNVLEVFVSYDDSFESQLVLAETAVSLINELNREGSVQEILSEYGFGGKVWLVESRKNDAASDSAIDRYADARDIVYSHWDIPQGKHTAVLRRHLADQAQIYAAKARRINKLTTASENPSAVKLELWVETAAALPGRGTLPGLVDLGRKSDVVNGIITGFPKENRGVIEIDWESIITLLRTRRKIKQEIADEMLSFLKNNQKPDGEISLEKQREITRNLTRIAAFCCAAEYGLEIDGDTINNITIHWSGAEAKIEKGFLTKQERTAAEYYARYAAGLPVEDTAVGKYIFQKWIEQAKEAGKKLNKNGQYLVSDLGTNGDSVRNIVTMAVVLLQNNSGIRIDLSSRNQSAAEQVLYSLHKVVTEGIVSGSISGDSVIKIKAAKEHAGLIKKLGFEQEVTVSADDENEFQSAAAEGAVLEYDVIDGASDTLQKLLNSSAGKVALKIGKEREDGLIVRVRNIDTERMGLLRLLDLIELIIPGKEAVTPEKRFARGVQRGKAAAKMLQADDVKELFEVVPGHNISRIWEAINTIDTAIKNHSSPAVVSIYDKYIIPININSRLKEELRRLFENIKRDAEKVSNPQLREVYLLEMRGILYGIIEKVFAERGEAQFKERVQKNADTAFDNLSAELSRYIGYCYNDEEGDFVISILSENNIEKQINIFSGIILLLNPDDQNMLSDSLLNAINDEQDDNIKIQSLLLFAEALARIQNQKLRIRTLNEVVNTLKGLHFDTGRLDNNQLALLANVEFISGQLDSDHRLNYKAAETLQVRLQAGNPDNDDALFLTMTLYIAEYGPFVFGTSESRKRALSINSNHSRYLYAQRTEFLKSTLTQLQVEQRLMGQVAALARYNTLPAKFDGTENVLPESIAAALAIMMEGCMLDNRQKFIHTMKTVSQAELKAMLSAA